MFRNHRFWLIAGLAFCLLGLGPGIATAENGDPTFRIDWVVPVPTESAPEGYVRLTSGEEELEVPFGAEQKRLEISVPGSKTPTIWTAEPRVEGFWSRSLALLAVDAERLADTGRLILWPTSELRGAVRVAEGEAMPDSVRVVFSTPETGIAGVSKERQISRGEVQCPIGGDDGEWSCEIPATVLDIALHAKGFVPIYLWQVPAEDPGRRLGTLKLKKGASLAGWVVTEDGRELDATARLTPRISAGPDSLTADRLSRAELEIPVQERGFFQFQGVGPGSYLLEIQQEGLAPVRAFPLEVWGTSETLLKEPLTLREPLVVELRVLPGSDPYGGRWRVEVFRGSEVSGGFHPQPEYVGAASEDGRVVIEEQSPGSFMVEVADSRGNPVYKDWNLEITGAQDGTRKIELDFVRIRGRLLLGEEPIAGTVWLGGRKADVQAEMTATIEDGFEGLLPRDGRWKVETISREHGIFHSGYVDVEDEDGEAFVEINIPDTEIFGNVVDASGTGVVGATVSGSGALDRVKVKSLAGGEISIRGLAPGEVAVSARARGEAGRSLSSETRWLKLTEGEPLGPITLTLTEAVELRGRVTSDRGPVPGALIRLSTVAPAGQGHSHVARTDIEGRFTSRRAPGAEILRAVVSAPGHSLTALDVEVPPPGTELALRAPVEGGELRILGLGEDLRDAGASKVLALEREGSAIAAPILFEWLAGHGRRIDTVQESLELPSMAPGRYRACLLEKSQLVEATFEGRGNRPDLRRWPSCAEGMLFPGDRLDLAIPKGNAEAAP